MTNNYTKQTLFVVGRKTHYNDLEKELDDHQFGKKFWLLLGLEVKWQQEEARLLHRLRKRMY